MSDLTAPQLLKVWAATGMTFQMTPQQMRELADAFDRMDRIGERAGEHLHHAMLLRDAAEKTFRMSMVVWALAAMCLFVGLLQ